MKIKKIQVVRPKVTVELNRPVLSRLCFLTVLPKLFMVKKATIKMTIQSAISKNAGHVAIKTVWIVCIPKIKVVDVK